MSGLQQALDALGLLSAEELEVVRRRVQAMRALGAESRGSVVELPGARLQSNDEAIVLGAIVDAIASIDADHTPLHVLRASCAPILREKVPGLLRYIGPGISRTQLVAIVHRGTALLARHLAEMNMPVTTRLVVRHLHRMPAVLNRAFPGYAQCGMLGMVARPEVARDAPADQDDGERHDARGRERAASRLRSPRA